MIKPLYNRVIIEPIEQDLVTKTGIQLLNSKLQQDRGTVVSAGPDCEVKKGDTAMYTKMHGREVTYEGKKCIVVQEPNIMVYWNREMKTPPLDQKKIDITALRVSNIEDIRIPKTFVLVKPDPEKNAVKMKSGVKLYIDTSFNPEKHAGISGEVIVVPSAINEKRTKTTIEVEKGDKVYFHYLSVQAAQKRGRVFKDGKDETYILVDYEALFLAVRKPDLEWKTEISDTVGVNGKVKGTAQSSHRGVASTKIEIEGDSKAAVKKEIERRINDQSEIIMLNGYVLVEALPDDTPDEIGGLLVPETAKKDHNDKWGIVRHIGKPLTGKKIPFKEGDKVLLSKDSDVPLEYDLHRSFRDGKKYFRIKHDEIDAVEK